MKGKRFLVLWSIFIIGLLVPVMAVAALPTDRISGADRHQTALAIADRGWQQADTVILTASEQEYLMETLLAAPLAGQENAPILLTPKNALHPDVKAKILALTAQNVYVIGSISDSVIAELHSLPGVQVVERLTGTDVQGTADAINSKLQDVAGTFVIGVNAVPDALSVSSFAAANRYQFALAGADGQAEPSRLQGPVYLIGGPGVVKDIAGATRYGGVDRYDTNGKVIAALYPNLSHCFVANGLTMVDALAAAPLLAQTSYQGAPVFLNSNAAIPALSQITGKLTANTEVIALGGQGAVPQTLLTWNIQDDGQVKLSTGTAQVIYDGTNLTGGTTQTTPPATPSTPSVPLTGYGTTPNILHPGDVVQTTNGDYIIASGQLERAAEIERHHLPFANLAPDAPLPAWQSEWDSYPPVIIPNDPPLHFAGDVIIEGQKVGTYDTLTVCNRYEIERMIRTIYQYANRPVTIKVEYLDGVGFFPWEDAVYPGWMQVRDYVEIGSVFQIYVKDNYNNGKYLDTSYHIK